MLKSLAISVACALLAITTCPARQGFVHTRDGRILEGHLRFESNVVVVVNVEKELWVKIALTNLAELAFAAPFRSKSDQTPESLGNQLPEPWQAEDVGSLRHAGNARLVSGQFHVRGGGTNILGESDSFHFVFKTVQDESELVARVTKVQFTDPWARAGLMMRESLASGSRNIFLAVSAGRGGVLQWRDRLNEGARVRLDRSFFMPCWLKLKRERNVFTALRSTNGKQWHLVDRVNWNATRELYVGLAVVGVREQTLNHSVFENVEEGPSLRNRWFIPQIELQSGSAVAGYIKSMDDTAVHFEPVSGKSPVSTLNIANVRFQPVPARLSRMLNAGREGALLSTGEFVDGECRGIADGKVILSSVPLGLCRFDCNDEVVALVLRKRSPVAPHAYDLKTADGSVWRAVEVSLDASGVVFREPSLGLKRIALHEFMEMRRRS